MKLEELLKKWERLDALPYNNTVHCILTDDSESLDKLARSLTSDHPVVADVGSWKGCSTSILANAVKDKGGKVYAIDHWKGNTGTELAELAKLEDAYSIFEHNMRELGLWDTIVPVRKSSQASVKTFPDGKFDLVFLDADHRYEQVKQDIRTWMPKVKIGGLICGHDCEIYYSKQNPSAQEQIDTHLKDDCIDGVVHPGVIKALYDIFEDKHQHLPFRIWSYPVRIWNYPIR